jgi:hypothetical protein
MSDLYDGEFHKRFFEIVGSPEEGRRISQAKAAQALGYSSQAALFRLIRIRLITATLKRLKRKLTRGSSVKRAG